MRKIIRIMDDDGEIHDIVAEREKIDSSRPWVSIKQDHGRNPISFAWQPKVLSIKDDLA